MFLGLKTPKCELVVAILKVILFGRGGFKKQETRLFERIETLYLPSATNLYILSLLSIRRV